MKKFTFKGYRADGDASKGAQEQKDLPQAPLNPQQRRREQVRRAQKTHRERKEAYVASLEAEVVTLRASETRILQEAKTLYTEVRTLKKLLADNGILLPASLQEATLQFGQLDIQSTETTRNTPPTPSFTLNIIQEKKGWSRRKQICIQKTPPVQPGQVPQYQMGPLIDPTQTSPTGDGWSPLSTALMSTQPDSVSLCLGDLDPTVVGMDFVLMLESPCLPHIDTADTRNTPSTSGHTLTVSASLLQYHPGPRGKRLNSPLAWQVPSTNIERLLELSKTIPLDESELTPVQAWDYIRRQTQYAEVEMERWDRLKEKLLGRIKCHGFGAVLDRDAFEDAVYEAFIVGRVF